MNVVTIMKQSVSMPAVFLFIVVVLLGCVTVLISRWKNRKINAFMASMPGPIPLPLIGTMYTVLGVKPEDMCTFLLNQFKKSKSVAHRWFDGKPILLTADLDITNVVLASPHSIDKTSDIEVFKNGSHGLVTYTGYQWRLTRNALTPGFKTNIKGASFAENYSYHIKTFVKILGTYADDNIEYDLFTVISGCVLDCLTDNFGHARLDTQKRRTDLPPLLAKATDMMFERLLNPFLRPDWVYSLLGKQKKFKKLCSVGETLVQGIIDQKIEVRNQLKKINPKAERPQIGMEVLLSNVDSGVIMQENAVGVTLDIVLAGCILPSTVLTGMLWLLSRNPEVQKKAYQEIIEAATGDEITLDDLPKLVYVEMVVKEALRHFTVPFVGRQVKQDLKINSKITIPAGVDVVMATYVIHHSAEFWEKPNEFYPEHFSAVNERKRPKGAFVPFLSGARSCPGQMYAMQSMTILVANILLHYEVWSKKEAPTDLSKEKYRILFALLPKERSFQIKRRNQKVVTGSA